MFRYDFTKKEAIHWHRRMWNWIAQTSIQEERCVTKEEALEHFGFKGSNMPQSNCFCCEYALVTIARTCNSCPVVWDDDLHCCQAEYGIWAFYTKHDCYVQAAHWAYKIAELPERPDHRPIEFKMFLSVDESPFKLLATSCRQYNDAISELSKMCCDGDEVEYQQKHKKVKDRYSSIFKVCNGERNTAGGYKWRYKDDQD